MTILTVIVIAFMLVVWFCLMLLIYEGLKEEICKEFREFKKHLRLNKGNLLVAGIIAPSLAYFIYKDDADVWAGCIGAFFLAMFAVLGVSYFKSGNKVEE